MRISSFACAASLFVTLNACSSTTATTWEDVGNQEDDLRVVATPEAIGFDRIRSPNMVHGVAGDERFIFVTEPLHGRIAIYGRFTGTYLGELPTPPGGFILPFALRIPETGRLVVLDAGGFPNPASPAVPQLYDYSYKWRLLGVTAKLERTVSFDGLPVGFSEDFEVLEDGTYVLSDSIVGSLWLVDPAGTISPGLVPSSLVPGEGLAPLQPCVRGPTVVDGLPFDLGGGYAPGIGSLAAFDGDLYWGGLCAGGLHRISIDTLRDTTRTAEERVLEVEAVSAAAPGALETLHGLAFNKFKPGDRHLYANDSLNMRVVRIDVDTGERSELLEDARLLNFAVTMHFLPPVLGVHSLLSAADQEHRFAALNQAIDEDLFRPPFVVAEVALRHP